MVLSNYRPTGKIVRGQASITVRVIPKNQKIIHDVYLLNTQHYKVRIKSKWSNPEVVVWPPTLWCSN